ncbi:MAG: S8/S53 family peptidase [Lysobacter sp.]|nr:S8/S53 family peptidase [Lysobacter sp.]
MATTSSRTSASKPAASKHASGTQVASTKYDVHGIILDLGESLPAPERRKILAQLRAEVPAFAALTTAKSAARPLGKGASDALVAFHDGKRITIAQTWNAVHALQQHPLVADCEPAVGYTRPPEPARPATRSSSGGNEVHLPASMPRDWSINAVKADLAQTRFGVTGAGVRIGHPDTGYTAHPQIAGPRLRIADGYDFVDDDADARDSMSGMHPGHGTATGSVIFSASAPELFGIAPGAELVPLRVSTAVIHFDFSNVVQALYRARDRGCHVVSMSLGGAWAGRSLSRATDQLVSEGMILIAAAGNHTKMVIFPALLDSVIAVAASNADNKPWSGSASGAAVDITAPGESVWRAYAFKKSGTLHFDTQRSSGTSYATATTAGVCALWLQRHGVATLRARYGARLASVFTTLLKAHCRPVPGWSTNRYGPGILDAVGLLGAELPAFGGAVKRSAQHAPTRTSAASDWTRLQPYLPELSPKQLAAAVTHMYGAGAKRSARSSQTPLPPPSVIDEIVFYVATDETVREAFLAAGGGAKPAARGKNDAAKRAGSALIDPRAVLRAKASAALRSALACE